MEKIKRTLDEQEVEYTEKGIARIEETMKDLDEQMTFNELTIEFQKRQSDYQDAIRPYLKKRKEQEDEKVMGTLKEQMAQSNATLENLKDQIKNGVAVKSVKEVKNGK